MYCVEDDAREARIGILERENARLRDIIGVCGKHSSLNVVLDAFCEKCDEEYSAKRAAREGSEMVKRYVANSDCLEGVMQEYEDGPFVRHSDYAALEAEFAAWKKKTYCAYCGKEYAIDTDGAIIAEHIATCDKHPMRAVEAKLARLRARTMDPARVGRVVKALEAWLAGSHFTIGDPTSVAQKLIAAADFEEWDGED
jgi:hypothetical protein